MNWLERIVARFALARLVADLGVEGMKKLAAIGVVLGGVIVVLAGLSDLLQHFISGDLLAQTCNDSNVCSTQLMTALTKIVAGIAVFSPGLAGLKAGPLARAPG